jgi:DNA polymerase-3 subunit delta'
MKLKMRYWENFMDRLREAIATNRLPSVFLLVGPSNCDLKVYVDDMSKLLLQDCDLGRCPNFFSIHPMGKMQQIAIDTVREVMEKLHLSPCGDHPRVVAIYGGNRLHRFAANALLKILEEPPQNVFFIITTDHLQEVLGTIRSRCQIYHILSQLDIDRTNNHVDPAWEACLGDWAWLITNAIKNPQRELWVEAYAFLQNFQALLQDDFQENEADQEDEIEKFFIRQRQMEQRLSDCAEVLYRLSMELLATDEDGRRRDICLLARRMKALEMAPLFLKSNYGESVALEAVIFALLNPSMPLFSHSY